jgi:hypothetical protein
MRTVLTFGLLLFVCAAAQAQNGKPIDTATASTNALEQHLIDLNTKWAAAEMKGDIAAINKILAPGYSLMGADGQTRDREAALHVKTPAEVTTSDYKLRLEGKTAVLTFSADFKNGDSSGQAKATQVWVKRGADWQVLSEQWTLVPRDPGAIPAVFGCKRASFEPEVHSLYGDVRTVLYKIDNDQMALPQRRVYIALLESDKGSELAYFERQQDQTYKVLRWNGDNISELREKLTNMILKNRGIACVGAQSKALIQAKLTLDDLGNIPMPLNANAAFSHMIRGHDGEYLRMTVFLLC